MGTHGTSHSYQQFSTSARILSDESSTNSINSNFSTDQSGRPIIDEVKIVNGLPQVILIYNDFRIAWYFTTLYSMLNYIR